MRPTSDRPVNDPLSRAGYVQKATIDSDPTRLLMAYPGYGRQPGESAEEVRQGSRARSQWHQETGVWRNAPLGPAQPVPLRSVAISQQFASGLFATHPSENWVVSYYASGGTTTLYAHPIDWSGSEPVFGTPVTLVIEDSGFIVGASAISFDSTGNWIILTGPWTTHTLRVYSFDDVTGAMAENQDVGSGTFPQSFQMAMCKCHDSHLAIGLSGGTAVRIYAFDPGTGLVNTTHLQTITTTACHSLQWSFDYTYPNFTGDTEYLFAGLTDGVLIKPFDRSAGTVGADAVFDTFPYPSTGQWTLANCRSDFSLIASWDQSGSRTAYWYWDFNPNDFLIEGPFAYELSPVASPYRFVSPRYGTASAVLSGIGEIAVVSVDDLSRKMTFTEYADPSGNPLSATRMLSPFSGYFIRANAVISNKLEIMATFLP